VLRTSSTERKLELEQFGWTDYWTGSAAGRSPHIRRYHFFIKRAVTFHVQDEAKRSEDEFAQSLCPSFFAEQVVKIRSFNQQGEIPTPAF
jgi:hypothetical protein